MKGNQKIFFMSQPNLIQQGPNGNNIPSLIGQPLIPIDMSNSFTSYTQMNRQIINEVIKTKNESKKATSNRKQLTIDEINDIYKTHKEKCEMHFRKLSEKCRKCKVIIVNIKNSQEKEIEIKEDSEENQKESKKQTKFKEKNNKELDYTNLQGCSVSGNLNSLLLNNILSCQYFKEVVIFKSFQDLILEIKNNVTNIEAWAVGISGVPSTFFCCFYRLILLVPSSQQIKHLLSSTSIFVKISGLLYIRFLSEPSSLWEYLSPFLMDGTLFYPTIDKKNKISIGEYVSNLFKEYNHYGTRLPRIPIQTEREIRMKLICFEEEKKRKKKNIQNYDKIIKGASVKVFNKAENATYIGKISNNTGIENYNEQTLESVKIEIDINGEIDNYSLGDFEVLSDEEELEEGEEKVEEVIDKKRKRHHHRRNKSRSRSRSKGKNVSNKNTIMQKVLEEEKRTALAHGKDYAIKPTSFKKSISVKVPGIIKKRGSHSPSPINHDIKVELVQSKGIVTNEKEEEVEKEKVKYSEEFLKRQEQLKKQYETQTKEKVEKKNLDNIGPEIMKLG